MANLVAEARMADKVAAVKAKQAKTDAAIAMCVQWSRMFTTVTELATVVGTIHMAEFGMADRQVALMVA